MDIWFPNLIISLSTLTNESINPLALLQAGLTLNTVTGKNTIFNFRELTQSACCIMGHFYSGKFKRRELILKTRRRKK